MTGLSTLLVELDDPAGSGAFPYDITPYVDLRAGWSLTRGRQDELGEVDPATAKLTLNNRDGRFTPGSTVYGGLVVDQRLRITETVGATTSRRITGYVQDWPVTFADPGARNVPCAITVTDLQARLNRAPLPNPMKYEALAAAPYAYYPMADEVDAKTSADFSGNDRPTLKSYGTATGVPYVAAVPGAAGIGFQFNAGTYLRSDHLPFACSAIGVWFTATKAPAVEESLVRVTSTDSDTTSDLTVRIGADGTVFGVALTADFFTNIEGFPPVFVCDGLPHFVLVYCAPDTSVTRMYVDGVLVHEITGGDPIVVPDKNRIYVGLRCADVVISNVSLYATVPPTGAQAASQYFSVMSSTEDSHDRFARIAGYAGLSAGDLALEPGVLTSTAPQSLESEQAASALSAVTLAEGGLWFVRGDGDVVLQNRTHRTYKASQPASVSVASDDVEHDDLVITTDKQYLQNLVTGSRPEGASQESKNAASATAYGVYPGGNFDGLLVTTDPEVKDRIDWQVNNYGQPQSRLSRVTFALLSLPSGLVEDLLALELGDRVVVNFLPVQSPMSAADLIVEGSEEQQNHESWSLTLNTVSASLFRVWILADLGYGRLGSTTRLHY